ncbi:MAG: hypothetical protein ACI9T7_003300 [Oleiphilaceae bacterium]|jgi:hypothetical protein
MVITDESEKALNLCKPLYILAASIVLFIHWRIAKIARESNNA